MPTYVQFSAPPQASGIATISAMNGTTTKAQSPMTTPIGCLPSVSGFGPREAVSVAAPVAGSGVVDSCRSTPVVMATSLDVVDVSHTAWQCFGSTNAWVSTSAWVLTSACVSAMRRRTTSTNY